MAARLGAPLDLPEPPAACGVEDFVYSEEAFVLRGVGWQDSPAQCPLSRFDGALQSGWKERQRLGLFRYRLGQLPTRILPGQVGFVAQLNIQRGLERRRPQDIQSLRQPFDPQQFSFCRIGANEIVFRLARRPAHPTPDRGERPAHSLVVINVSPLEFGHVLLIPEPALCLPQVLTPELLRFGMDAVLLSSHPGFRVGFNSLGAFASINHLHMHGFYLDWELLVESAPCQPLCPTAGLHLLQGVPAPGFVFYSEGRGLKGLAHRVCRITDHLVQKEIAHNLLVTRGAAPGDPPCLGARAGLRVILWARKSSFGAKEETAFNVALCELAGHLPIKNAQDFQSLTEASAIGIIQKYLLPAPQLAQLQGELVALLTD